RGGLEFKIIARNAYILRTGDGEDDSLRFTFEDGYVLASTETGEPLLDREPATSIQMGRAQQVGFSVLFNEFFGTGRYIDQARDMSLSSLMYANERGGVWRGTRRRVGVAMHRSIALGCAPLAMGLFALAMGLLLPATGRRVRDFVLCFLTPVVLYFPLFLAGPALGRQGTLPAWLAMWNANIVVGVLGLLLLAVAFRR
ncbi:MAG: LptF/LptG family permease, partial [Planctomycetota bacterium]